MPGKRLTDSGRAHHGPEEDRARKPAQDRAAGKMRSTPPPDPALEGLSAKDKARLERFRAP